MFFMSPQPTLNYAVEGILIMNCMLYTHCRLQKGRRWSVMEGRSTAEEGKEQDSSAYCDLVHSASLCGKKS